jgi:serine/threonine-protein kinase
LGKTDQALDWLERLYAEAPHNLLFIKTDFEYDPLRKEPRFQAILKKMNLAE